MTAPTKLRPTDLGKPRMRGWLHAYAFFVAAVCGIVLCSLAATRPGIAPIISCAIYSLTVCGLFGDELRLRGVQPVTQFALARERRHAAVGADGQPRVELIAADAVESGRQLRG